VACINSIEPALSREKNMFAKSTLLVVSDTRFIATYGVPDIFKFKRFIAALVKMATLTREKQLTINVYTDGACSGNPGPGGWGTLLEYSNGDASVRLKGGEKHTTNNVMELTGAIKALERVLAEHKSGARYRGASASLPKVRLTTDSTYVKNGITDWIVKWEKNRWRTSKQKPVANVALWKQLRALTLQLPTMEWHWVKGHSNDAGNDEADRLANEGMAPFN
jgi:ribonuclease HI